MLEQGKGLTTFGRRRFARYLLGSAMLASPIMSRPQTASKPGTRRNPSITDIEGLLVGHFTLRERPTGCTVILAETAFTAGVDVRGGSPGTRETDLLRPENTVEKVNAIVLSGGSAFGLDTATGVSQYLEELGRGYEVRGTKVPIVCGAILLDLALGDAKIRPDARAGYQAAKAASRDPVPEGNVGAGAGCTVGKMFGLERAMKTGLGSWAMSRPNGLKIGAVVAVNCAGDVVDPLRGKILAGARKDDRSGFLDALQQLRQGYQPGSPFRHNTVIGVVATNAILTKTQCSKMAQMAQDALARCIYPSHTPWDGDTIFALATGEWGRSAGPDDVGIIGALAADVMATAILRSVQQAESWGAYPAARDYPRQH